MPLKRPGFPDREDVGGEVPIRALVVEDDPQISRVIAHRLQADGMQVEVANDATSVIRQLEAGSADWDVVLLDIGLPEISGIELLHRFRETASMTSVIMLTGDKTADTAAACMRAGAFHYVTKPFPPFELSTIVRSAARYSSMRRQLAGLRQGEEAAKTPMIGASTAMRRIHAALDRLATQAVLVLIQGESGTGKELVARALHERGPRCTKPFVALNCGAFPESLIDSELFGHSKGAFTGATKDRQGVFLEADGGTLFLDEIGDMPMQVQARLLRVLQESEVRAVGGSGVRTIDVRVVAASHVNLQLAVEQGKFRRDLFYRLNVVVLKVPPLRERLDDLPRLCAHFLRKHGGADPPSLSSEALEALDRYAWPGNIRELENALIHAIALCSNDVLGPETLPAAIGGRVRVQGSGPVMRLGANAELLPLSKARSQMISTFERAYLVAVMERAKGSVSEAARLADTDRTHFRRLLQRYHIEPTSYQ